MSADGDIQVFIEVEFELLLVPSGVHSLPGVAAPVVLSFSLDLKPFKW